MLFLEESLWPLPEYQIVDLWFGQNQKRICEDINHNRHSK